MDGKREMRLQKERTMAIRATDVKKVNFLFDGFEFGGRRQRIE